MPYFTLIGAAARSKETTLEWSYLGTTGTETHTVHYEATETTITTPCRSVSTIGSLLNDDYPASGYSSDSIMKVTHNKTECDELFGCAPVPCTTFYYEIVEA
jgi:hypothetical protein